MMGELMLLPLPLSDMNRILFRERSKPQLLLLARALEHLTFAAEDRIAYMYLSWQDFLDCGALPEHSEAIVNFALDVQGVKLAFLARETELGDVKLSMRALPPCKVDGIAAELSGGGHALAAGCTLSMPLEQAVATIAGMMEKELQTGANA